MNGPAEWTTIITPSMDNRAYLEPCLASIREHTTGADYAILVVNNGAAGSCDWITDPNVCTIEAGGNRGWEGALQLGLRASVAPYVLFLNDDTAIPATQERWLWRLCSAFSDPRVAAVGPMSNCVAGAQSVRYRSRQLRFSARYLIGFCLLVRRSALDAVGGIDASLPGGDDIDLSIRLRAAGYTLQCDRTVFVQHYGFKTGTRVHGDHTVPGGWNSPEMTRATLAALAAKHGQVAVSELWQAP